MQGCAVSETERQLLRVARAISRANGHFTVMIDKDFTIQWASETSHQIFGWSSLTGKNMADLVHPDDFALVLESIAFHSALSTEYAKRLNPAW